jgi:hypothetical protein
MSSCPLLRLPPELRILIYTHTQQLRLDLDIHESGGTQLSQAWESTPIVNFAATCRLIAQEARDYMRSMPGSQRTALVDFLGQRGPNHPVKIRLHQLPCPVSNLRQAVAMYSFDTYKNTAYHFPPANSSDTDVRVAVSSMGYWLFQALYQLMCDPALKDAINLSHIWLRIEGLPPKEDDESQAEAMRKVLEEPKAYGDASAGKLAQEVFHWDCVYAEAEEFADTDRPAFFERRLLRLRV